MSRRESTAAPPAAVLLAAGGSSRLPGERPKQLLELGGEPLVRQAARTALASCLRPVIVVLGHRADDVARALAGLDLTTVTNPRWRDGQSTSVRAGLAALPTDTPAALFLPCDQPLLTASLLDRLVAAWEDGRPAAVVPAFRGRRGAPALLDRRLFAELAAIRGDEGGRQVLRRHPDLVVELELDSAEPLADLDTAADLRRLRGMIP